MATAPPTSVRHHQLKITLRHGKPPIWRRVLVTSDMQLPFLHQILQAAMGWHDSHLHLFRVGDRCLALPADDFEPLGDDERLVSLAQLAPRKGSRFVYEYDFGDGWEHDVLVEDVVVRDELDIRCLAGKRACPPEDCGGVGGYAELLAVLADPVHESHQEMMEWTGGPIDPEEFDLSVINDRIVDYLRSLLPKARRRTMRKRRTGGDAAEA
jgi:hypothetical protein